MSTSLIDLVSSEANHGTEVIELLSSSPVRVPEKEDAAQLQLLTSSPLFDFEVRTRQRMDLSSKPSLPSSPIAKQEVKDTPQASSRKRRKSAKSENIELFGASSTLPDLTVNANMVETEPSKRDIQTRSDNSSHSVESTLHFVEDDDIRFLPRSDNLKQIQEASADSVKGHVPRPKRPRFKGSMDQAPPAAKHASTSSGSKIAAAANASDRKKVAERLICQIWIDKADWSAKLKDEFLKLECFVEIDNSLGAARTPPAGVSLAMTAYGNFDDTWDSETQIFVKSDEHKEPMDTAIVIIEAEYLDTLGSMAVEERDVYFEAVTDFIINQCGSEIDILYMFPEVGSHFRKRVDRFNREMRRLVSSGGSGVSNGPTASNMGPPDEQFYTTLEAELQILNDIRAFYPRKAQDAAEMIANCTIDMGVSRYHNQLPVSIDNSGAVVRSKSTPLDVTVEALTKIQGLPPRIAAKLGSEAQTLGRIRHCLGANREMRASRIKRFGRGSWNDSLLSFLEDDDPQRII